MALILKLLSLPLPLHAVISLWFLLLDWVPLGIAVLSQVSCMYRASYFPPGTPPIFFPSFFTTASSFHTSYVAPLHLNIVGYNSFEKITWQRIRWLSLGSLKFDSPCCLSSQGFTYTQTVSIPTGSHGFIVLSLHILDPHVSLDELEFISANEKKREAEGLK